MLDGLCGPICEFREMGLGNLFVGMRDKEGSLLV